MYVVKKFENNKEVKEFETEYYTQAIIHDIKKKFDKLVTCEQYILVDGSVHVSTDLDGIHYIVRPTVKTADLRKAHDLKLLSEVVADILSEEDRASCTITVGQVFAHQHYILTFEKENYRKDLLIPETDLHMYSHARLVTELVGELNEDIKR